MSLAEKFIKFVETNKLRKDVVDRLNQLSTEDLNSLIGLTGANVFDLTGRGQDPNFVVLQRIAKLEQQRAQADPDVANAQKELRDLIGLKSHSLDTAQSIVRFVRENNLKKETEQALLCLPKKDVDMILMLAKRDLFRGFEDKTEAVMARVKRVDRRVHDLIKFVMEPPRSRLRRSGSRDRRYRSGSRGSRTRRGGRSRDRKRSRSRRGGRRESKSKRRRRSSSCSESADVRKFGKEPANAVRQAQGHAVETSKAAFIDLDGPDEYPDYGRASARSPLEPVGVNAPIRQFGTAIPAPASVYAAADLPEPTGSKVPKGRAAEEWLRNWLHGLDGGRGGLSQYYEVIKNEFDADMAQIGAARLS